MSICEHVSCGNAEKVWLPVKYRGRHASLKSHRYCIKCGTVKSISSDRPLPLGYYVNVLAGMGKYFKITSVQMRLIVQDLEKSGIDDFYGIDRYQQEMLFISSIRKFLHLKEIDICKALRE